VRRGAREAAAVGGSRGVDAVEGGVRDDLLGDDVDGAAASPACTAIPEAQLPRWCWGRATRRGSGGRRSTPRSAQAGEGEAEGARRRHPSTITDFRWPLQQR
jgi:hypothetical protein